MFVVVGILIYTAGFPFIQSSYGVDTVLNRTNHDVVTTDLDLCDRDLADLEAREARATAKRATLASTIYDQQLRVNNLAKRINALENWIPIIDSRLPSSCAVAKVLNPKSRVVTLAVGTDRITVYCDQETDGGGWTVIQRRQNGRLSFQRTWDEYAKGFGDPNDEVWLGLENVHLMTRLQWYTLRVDMERFSGETAYAKYSYFKIYSADLKYRLHATGFSGTAGDSFKDHHHNRPFTTIDKDNDDYRNNCAQSFSGGGWWYWTCFIAANLNGVYGETDSDPHGILWRSFAESESLSKVEMKIRPRWPNGRRRNTSTRGLTLQP